MAWTPPSDAVETQASTDTAVNTGWTPPSDAIKVGAAPVTGWTPPADAIKVQAAPATTVAEPQEPLGNAMGEDFGSAIMAVSAPKKQSVLEGVDMPEPAYNPAELNRLSQRKYAEEQAQIYDPRYRQKLTQGAPRKPLSKAEVEGMGMQGANPIMRVGQKALRGGAEGVGGILRGLGDLIGSDTVAGTGEYMAKNAKEYQEAMGPAITGDIQGFGPKSFVPDLLKYTADMGEGAASSLVQSIAASSLGPKAVIPVLSILSGGDQYNKARTAGKSPLEALENAVPFGAFEAIGEKFAGLDKAAAAMKTLVNGGASDVAKRQAGDTLLKMGVKEIPGEVVTYLGQTGVDLLPGIGLNPNLTMDQFIDGLRDTVVQAALMGTAVGGVGLYTKNRTPAPAVKPPAPITEKEKPAPVVDKRQALKDALAKRMKPAAEVQPAPTTVPSEPAPTEVTPEVQPAPSPEFETLVAKYKKRGYMPEDAATLARNEIEEANAPTKEGAENVAEPISEAGGEGTALSTQPADNVPATERAGEAERDGVVPARPDVTESAEGEGTKPVAVTKDATLYHGTNAEYETIDPEKSGGMTFFGEDESVAMRYAQNGGGGRARLNNDQKYIVNQRDGVTYELDGDVWKAIGIAPDEGLINKNTIQPLDKARPSLSQAEAEEMTNPDSGTAAVVPKTSRIIKKDFSGLKLLDISTPEGRDVIAGLTPTTGVGSDLVDAARFDARDKTNRNDVTQLNANFWGTTKYASAKGDQLKKDIVEPLKALGYDGIRFRDDQHNSIALFDTGLSKEKVKPKGETVGTKTPEAVQAKEEGQEAPAAGAVSKGKRGRPKADITEEQRAEKEKARTENRAEYMKGERALPKLQAKLDEAAAPIDESKFADDLELSSAQDEKRALKRDTINAMMDLEAKHRGTALGKRVKAALADRSKISQKDHDDVLAGRKYKSQERVNKSTASNEEVEDADEGFKKATNAAQAINHVIKTGTGFQKFLAKRLRGLVNGVKFVVVEETDPLPEQLSRHQEAWGNENSRARGVYFENTATGEKVIYVRGASAGGFQGINNTTVLHELLHAATQQKLELALLAVQRGFSGDAKLVRAYNDLIAVMNNAKDEYNRLSNLGQLPTDIYYLKTVSGVFSNPHEFVSYGMTDPYFQKFLMGAYGFEEETGLFNRFVDAIRELLGMGIDTVNALSDLIVVTDKILNAKLTPTMQMIVKADKANAIREGRGEKVSAAKAKAKVNAKKISVAEKKILRSKEAQGVVDGIDTMVKLRDPQILLDTLASVWNALNVKKLQALMPSIQTNILVEWGTNLGITHMDKTWRAMQDMGAMRMKMLGGASDVVNKWLNVQPSMYGKLVKGKKDELNELSAVMHYATDKSIDPATSRKDAKLNKMWDGLSDTAKEIYIDVRDYYKSNFDLYRLLLNNRIDAMKIPGEADNPDTPKGKLMAEIKKMYETAKGLSPYFPLMRYGDYWLRVGSGKKKEFYMFESVVDREMFLRQRVRDLQKEGDERSLEKMKADQDIETGNDLKGLRDKSTANDTAPLLKQIFELIGEGISETDAETLKDQIYQLYLTTMPEQSFRRQFIHRKGTAGFSGDALRNFITSSTNMANQLARLKYGPQMIREVDAAKESLKGNPEKDKLEMLVNELGERVQMEVYPPAVDAVARTAANVANKSAFLYFMTSVKTAVVQFSSLPVFGAPVLMSRHSPASVVAEMGKMMLIFNDVGVIDKDGKLSQVSLANSRRVKMSEEEQRAIEAMTDRGVSEITMAYDLMDRSKTPSAKYSGAWKSATNMMGGLFHHVERLNREVMFMTSFRLSRKEGMSFDDAVDQAVKDTYDALGNFSEQNRARIMRGPLGRTLLQFKTYPTFVTTYLVRNGYRAMAGMDADAKKEAATQLFGTLMMSGLLAGYVGIPGISAAMGAIQGLINAFKDDDDDDPLEERDIEFWFRSVFIPNFFGEAQIGGQKISEIIDSGLIDTISGYNMSNSLSMNNMWFPDLKEQRNFEDTVQEYALSMMGPFASLALNQIPSAIRLLQEGKTMQGLERLLPAALRQPLTAVRYSKEGATTSTGAVIKEPEEFTKAQLTAQALGARSTGLASVQEANFKANALKAKVMLEKGKIINRVDLEATRGSDQEFDDALEKLITFNARNPQVAVKGEQLSKMLQARMEKRLKADRGFDVDKKFYPYLEELLAPSREKIEREAAK